MSRFVRILVSLGSVAGALLGVMLCMGSVQASAMNQSVTRAPQAGTISVTLQPASLNVAAGQNFTVALVISNVTDLASFDVELNFDPATVTVTNWTLNTALPALAGWNRLPASGLIFLPGNRIFFGADDNGGISAAPFTGDGTLGFITFQALNTGVSNLQMVPTLYGSDFDTLPDPVAVTNSGVTVFRNSCTWTGSSSVEWNTAGNWSGNLVPTKYDDVILPPPSGPYWPTVNAASTVHNLTVQAGAQLTLSNVLAVMGMVTNNGRLYQTQGVHIAGAPIVFMNLQDTGGTIKYQGLVITPTADMGNVTVALNGNQACGVNGTLPESIRRCYDITPQNQVPATVQFFYTAAEANSNVLPNAYHWNSVAGTWTALPSTRGGSGDALWVRADTNSYSPFTLKDDQPTAVTLLSLQTNSHGPTLPWLGLFLVIGGLGVLGLWRHRSSRSSVETPELN